MFCNGCLWYCKSTIFQANHNQYHRACSLWNDVCDTAKVRFFKQITTSSLGIATIARCLWYCKSTIFQANHNMQKRMVYSCVMFVILQKYDFSSKSQHILSYGIYMTDVCDTAKVRFFKQITTTLLPKSSLCAMFVILQKYDFSSKSQLTSFGVGLTLRCLWYCKSTIFQANHNDPFVVKQGRGDVCDTAKVRFFKQITTLLLMLNLQVVMFVILQKYDFSSKSQQVDDIEDKFFWCLWYCKSTIFQANHNHYHGIIFFDDDVCDTAKVRFFKQITTSVMPKYSPALMFVILQKYDFSSKSQHDDDFLPQIERCLWYCKSTIFQANHNCCYCFFNWVTDVCDTAKVRFFKQITTRWALILFVMLMFVILQKYDFSSKSQQ